jgi:hypothetical protein
VLVVPIPTQNDDDELPVPPFFPPIQVEDRDRGATPTNQPGLPLDSSPFWKQRAAIVGMATLLILGVFFGFLAWTGATPRLDASSEKSLETSVQRMTAGLSDDQKTAFAQDCIALTLPGMMTTAFLNAFSQGKLPTGDRTDAFKPLQGMSVAEIHAKAEGVRRTFRDRLDLPLEGPGAQAPRLAAAQPNPAVPATVVSLAKPSGTEPKPQPAPKPEPDKGEEWIDPPLEYMNVHDEITVEIKSVVIGKAKLKSVLTSNEKHESSRAYCDQECLLISLRVFNASMTRKIEYKSWAERGIIPVVYLHDNFGNRYKRGFFGMFVEVEGATKEASLYPMSMLDDLLIFEVPVWRANVLYLELPGENIGCDGKTLRFRIPTKMIRRDTGSDGVPVAP